MFLQKHFSLYLLDFVIFTFHTHTNNVTFDLQYINLKKESVKLFLTERNAFQFLIV